MKLSVENLGPIQKGEIDLSKRFYVFVGYNNSGKTYMSELLWSVFNNHYMSLFFSERIKNLPEFKDVTLDNPFLITKELVCKILNEFELFFKEKFISNTLHLSKNHFLNDDFSIFFNKEYVIKQVFEKELSIALGFNTQSDKFIQVMIDGQVPPKKEGIPEEIFIAKKEKDSFSISFNQVDDFDLDTISLRWSHDINRKDVESERIAGFIVKLIFSFNKFTSLFLLPANRNFYPNFYKYIFSVAKEEKELIDRQLINGADIEKIRNLAKHPYTESMNQLITMTNNLNRRIVANTYYSDLLEDLEKIIGGSIEVASVEGIAPIEFKLKMKDGKELDMHLVSSSSNQLTTFYLYLKYWASPHHNFLLLDEPEENLHPQNQIALIDILMRFGNSNNNRVLITTHSPLMTETINNYIQLSNLQTKGINTKDLIDKNELQMNPITDLKPTDFGVYFFNGKSIIDYQVKDYGVFFSDFKKVQKQIKNIHYVLNDEIFNLTEKEIEA